MKYMSKEEILGLKKVPQEENNLLSEMKSLEIKMTKLMKDMAEFKAIADPLMDLLEKLEDNKIRTKVTKTDNTYPTQMYIE